MLSRSPPERTSSSPGNLALLFALSALAFYQGCSLNPELPHSRKSADIWGRHGWSPRVTVDRPQAQSTFSHTQQLNLLEGLQAPDKVVKVRAGLNPPVSILFRSSGAILGQAAGSTQIYYPEAPPCHCLATCHSCPSNSYLQRQYHTGPELRLNPRALRLCPCVGAVATRATRNTCFKVLPQP